MSCTTDYCGTGESNIPKPGDPSNNGVLTAKPAFGGIDLGWTYPTVNPFAVSYTSVHRARSNQFNMSIIIAGQVGSGHYRDPVEPGVEFFYWITFTSVNGTIGEPIGPASAIARDAVEGTLEELTGKIDNGVLAQSLKTEIARISENAASIIRESQIRLDGQAGLSDQILGQQEVTDETVAAVFAETTAREDADSAMVDSINLLYAQAGENTAAILEESRVRAEEDEVLAQKIITTETTLGDNIAQVQTNLQSQITEVDGVVTDIGALYTAKVNVNGLIGGFGIFNDGTEVESGFDVDRFWIGRTSVDKVKPFIIDNGIVYIDKARIRDADIDTLKIAGNAVTIPSYMEGIGESGVRYYNGVSHLVGSLNMNITQAANMVAIVTFQSLSSASGDGFNPNVTVSANDVNFLFQQNSGLSGFDQSWTAVGRVFLNPGVSNFKLTFSNNWPGSGYYVLGRWSILLLGIMR